MQRLVIDSLADLPDAAECIVELLCERPSGQRVVALYGPMGAGKTTLIREIAAQMGVRDNVTSPTFALVNEYHTSTGEPLYHFDFYRIERIEEAFDLGYEEYFYGGALCLVEWPEKIEELLPPGALRIEILPDPHDEGARTILISV